MYQSSQFETTARQTSIEDVRTDVLLPTVPDIPLDGRVDGSDKRLLVVVGSGKTEDRCLEFAKRFAEAIRADIRVMRPASIDPANEVRSMATVFRADWICMVTHGGPGLMTLFLRRKDERVLRLAPCPVVCIPESLPRSCEMESENSILRPAKRILVPLHPTHDARATLDRAVHLAERFEAKIDLLRVEENLSEPTNSKGPSIRGARKARTVVTMSELATLAEASIPKHLQGQREISWGVPLYHATSRAMRKFESDLIVLASQTRLWRARSRIDIGTERILRSVNCPVICVPERNVRSAAARNEHLRMAWLRPPVTRDQFHTSTRRKRETGAKGSILKLNKTSYL